MNLPRFSVKHPVTTLMIFVAALIIGAICIALLPVDLMPKIDLPSISVMTTYEGAAPEDVESKVTEPLERSLSSVPELKHITSVSKEGISVITLAFEWGTDLDTRSNEVRDYVGMTRTFLPDDADDPRVFKFDMSRFPILFFAVKAEESYPQLDKILEDEIGLPLKRLPGVAAVSVFSPLKRQINIHVDKDRLAASGLSMQEVARAIGRENANIPAGNIKIDTTDYLIRVPGEYKEVRPMDDLVLAARDGSVIRLSDVAEVEDGYKEITMFTRIDGQRGARLMIQKESEANTVKVARAVRKTLAQLQKHLPSDVEIITVMDSSEDIERLIHDLSETLLLGGLLAMGVVLLFLRQWRATLVIGLTIPFSLMIAMIANYFMGFTINMLTLFALIIAVGMIVDNAIVVLESITRRREAGERSAEASIYGTSEVAMAISASTLTTVCIFFPIMFVQGITRVIFKEFALAVSVLLLASLFSALTLAPMLSSTLMKIFQAEKKDRLGRFYIAMENFYASALGWALGHRKLVMGAASLVFISSLLLVPKLGSEFMPEQDKGIIQATIRLPIGTRSEITAGVALELEGLIEEVIAPEERTALFSRAGVSSEGIASMMSEEGTHIAFIAVKLVPQTKRKRSVQDIAAKVRERIESEQARLNIEEYSLSAGDPMSGLISGGESPLTINVLGDNMEATDIVAERIKKIAEDTPGAVDIRVTREKGRPELNVKVDRFKASLLGVNVSDVGDVVRSAFYGTEAGKFRQDGDEYDIFIRMRESDRDQISDLESLSVRTASGELMPIANVASISFTYSPVEIDRKDQGRIVNVVGNVQGRSLGDVVKDIEEKIKSIEIPHDVQVITSGETEEQREAFLWLSVALAIGILLVYMVMASQFESLLDPFVVLFSIPFAFTGAIWAIFLFGHHISIVVFIGLLLLTGVVVNNAIVLVDYINILRARGNTMHEAVMLGGKTRLRPVLMTTLTTLVALLPMAFGKGQSSEMWNPLGLTVMSGLLVSTLVTLILVPTMYSILESHVRIANNSSSLDRMKNNKESSK